MTILAVGPDEMMDMREYWDFADPVGSEARFRALSETVADWSLLAEVEAQIARCMGLTGRFDEGHAVLDAILARGQALTDRARASIAIERGRLFNSAGDKETARRWFVEAQSWPVEDLTIDALHMMAFVLPPEEGRAATLEALRRAEASDDPWAKRWQGSLLNNLGWDYHEAGDFEVALGYFERAEVARRAAGDAKALAIAEWCRARCLRSLGRFDKALAILGAQDWVEGDKYLAEEMAANLEALGRDEEAEVWRGRA